MVVLNDDDKGLKRDNESIKYLVTPTDDSYSVVTTPLSSNGPKEKENDDSAEDVYQISVIHLEEIAELLSQVRLQVYRLMEVDSIPKFLETLSERRFIMSHP